MYALFSDNCDCVTLWHMCSTPFSQYFGTPPPIPIDLAYRELQPLI